MTLRKRRGIKEKNVKTERINTRDVDQALSVYVNIQEEYNSTMLSYEKNRYRIFCENYTDPRQIEYIKKAEYLTILKLMHISRMLYRITDPESTRVKDKHE